MGALAKEVEEQFTAALRHEGMGEAGIQIYLGILRSSDSQDAARTQPKWWVPKE